MVIESLLHNTLLFIILSRHIPQNLRQMYNSNGKTCHNQWQSYDHRKRVHYPNKVTRQEIPGNFISTANAAKNNSQPPTEQKFQPTHQLRPAHLTPDMVTSQSGHATGTHLANTMGSTTTATSSSSHQELFENVNLRRINVMSKKGNVRRLFESSKTASRPDQDPYQINFEARVPSIHSTHQKPTTPPQEQLPTSRSIDCRPRSQSVLREPPPIQKLNWYTLKNKITHSYTEKKPFVLNCRVSQPRLGTNFCNCDFPCKWATRWLKWTNLMPIDDQLYNNLRRYPVRSETQVQIDKDIRRTQPTNPSFQQQGNLQSLREILTVYSVYDMQTDYVQGMNLIVSVLLYHIKHPEKCFWVFVDLMEKREFKQIYLDNFNHLKLYIQDLLKLLKYRVNDLYQHFQQLDLEVQHIAYGWFLSLMCNIIPLQYAHLVIDRFICRGWMGFLCVVLTYLIYLKEALMKLYEASDILARFSNRNEDVRWDEILAASQNLYVTRQQLQSMSM